MAHSDSGAEDARSTASITPDITEEQALLQDDTSAFEANPEHRAGDEEEDEGIADVHRLSRLSTSTAKSEIFDFIKEFGRTYHQYHEGKYLMPNDEKEKDRLDFQHKLWSLTLGSELYLAPIDDRFRAQGGNVLDMCTGTGIWAIDFADAHDSAVVTGIDLSPIQPQMVSPNLVFLVDDAEDEWPEEIKYDYIHGRMLSPCFKRIDKVIEQAVGALKPGGFLEFQDAMLSFKCDDGSLGPAMEKWQKMLDEAVSNSGRDWSCPTKYEQYMRRAGLVDVTEVKFKWPTNLWPVNKHEKILGAYSLVNLPDWIEAASLAVMIKYLNMTREEVNEILTSVMMEIVNEDIHAYIPVNVIYGQKPATYDD